MLIIAILILVNSYMLAGYATAQSLSVAYDKSKWYLLHLVILFWPIHVIWAIIGMCVEGFTWVHNKIFPKE